MAEAEQAQWWRGQELKRYLEEQTTERVVREASHSEVEAANAHSNSFAAEVVNLESQALSSEHTLQAQLQKQYAVA